MIRTMLAAIFLLGFSAFAKADTPYPWIKPAKFKAVEVPNPPKIMPTIALADCDRKQPVGVIFDHPFRARIDLPDGMEIIGVSSASYNEWDVRVHYGLPSWVEVKPVSMESKPGVIVLFSKRGPEYVLSLHAELNP